MSCGFQQNSKPSNYLVGSSRWENVHLKIEDSQGSFFLWWGLVGGGVLMRFFFSKPKKTNSFHGAFCEFP